MKLVRATLQLCAVLLALTALGCTSKQDDDTGVGGSDAGNSTGGTSSTTQATGGKSSAAGGNGSTGGSTSTSAAGATSTAAGNTSVTGGASNVAGATSTAAGGTTTTGTSPVTGGASTTTGGSTTAGGATVGGTTSAAGNTSTGGSTAVQTFSISGTVSGLSGTGLSLAIGSDTLAVSASGAFAFPKKYNSGASIAVTVSVQPTGPHQTCAVSAAGAVASLTQDVTNVAVTCTTDAYTVGGSLAGLSGTGLILQDNAGDDLTVAANGTFTFATKVASGAAYTVTVKTQPTSPAQNCTVSGGSGTVVSSNVSSITVNCSTQSFTIGGTLAGLDGTGLVLQNNAGDDVTPNANGSFAFATPVLSGQPFAVTVKTQPTLKSQTCVVTGGNGTVAAANVTTVSVDCTTNKYAIGGSITGLAGTGLTLQNNLDDNLAVSPGTSFVFPTQLASGSNYAVTILTQPNSPTQVCTVATGTGAVVDAAITSVAITCTTSSFTVGGSVSGMQGSGLVLTNNGGDDVTVDTNTTFTFATSVLSGANYKVAIKTQPAGEYCSVAGGTGTMGGTNVTSVAVNCSTEAHSVSGSVSGLAGSGLELSLNGGDPQAISGNGTFAFSTPIAKGGAYEVTIAQEPSNPWQTCVLTNASGTVASADITDVTVSCSVNSYPVGGTVSGLKGAGLVLQNNGGNNLAITGNGSFVFPINVISGLGYAVTVKAQPTSPMQVCTVDNGGGSVTGAAITNISVTCITNQYTVAGTISGLVGSVVLADNTTDTLTLTANGDFIFDQSVDSGATYNVAVQTQPASPSQTCTVTAGSGPVIDANIGSVVVTCVTNKFKVGGTTTGLGAGQSLVLQNNGGDNLTISSDGSFAFDTSITSGNAYAVSILSGPLGQNCTLSGASGNVGGSDVTNVSVNCTNKPTVGGSITGLSGSGLVLNLNGSEDLAVSNSGTFAFTTPFNGGDTYAVTVKTQPTTPWQVCTVTNGTGSVDTTDVTSVAVNCVSNTYTLSVNVSGLSGTGLVLQNNNADNLSVAASGTSPFATQVASGANYTVTVLTQPSSPAQICTVTSPTGTVANADITLAVTCVTTGYTVGGTVVGGNVSGMVLQNNAGDNLSISSTGAFTFATKVASGGAYAVTILTSPPGTNCGVYSGTGTVASANVTSVFISCSPPYNFDYDTQGWYTNATPTGSALTWSSTEGSPNVGSLSASLALSSTACPSGMQIGVTASPVLNISSFTTMTAKIRVDGAWPTTDRSGGFQLYIQDSAGNFVSGTFISWWSLSLGTWYSASTAIPTGADLTTIKNLGVNIYNGTPTAPATCQAMTMYIDSVGFQ